MFKVIKFFAFSNGQILTIAEEIENYAHSLGAPIRIDPDGTRHPGSVCNKCLRDIKSDSGLRKVFNLQNCDCVQLEVQATRDNRDFIDWCYAKSIIHPSTIKEGKLDLYSVNAAHAICKLLLRDAGIAEKRISYSDMLVEYLPFDVTVTVKKLDPKRLRVENSLLSKKDKKCSGVPSVISMLTAEEQAVVRKYSQLVKSTRDNGRPYIKKRR